MKCIILAGGSGQRFWPFSSKETPKQFLCLFGEKSLLRQTYERMRFRLQPDDIYVVTGKTYVEKTLEELPEIKVENVIAEPFRRDTAGASFLASLFFPPEEIILTVPADHYIPDTERYWSNLEFAEDMIKKTGGLYVFGIKPLWPETGYGYIEVGNRIEGKLYMVDSFHEKPDRETAQKYINRGNFFWNSGMHLWKNETFFEEMRLYFPEIYYNMKNINCRNEREVYEAFEKIPSISIDYALFEKSKKVMSVVFDINWSDVGNWESIFQLEGPAQSKENRFLIDSENILIKTHSEKPVAVIGCKNLIIAETENGLLISDIAQSQKVKQVAKILFSPGEK